jgi:hypothetical protein
MKRRVIKGWVGTDQSGEVAPSQLLCWKSKANCPKVYWLKNSVPQGLIPVRVTVTIEEALRKGRS